MTSLATAGLALFTQVASAQSTTTLGWSSPFATAPPQSPTLEFSQLDVLDLSNQHLTRLSGGNTLTRDEADTRGLALQVSASLRNTVVPAEHRYYSAPGPVSLALSVWSRRRPHSIWSAWGVSAGIPADLRALEGPYALFFEERMPFVAVFHDSRRPLGAGELGLNFVIGAAGIRLSADYAHPLGAHAALCLGASAGLPDLMHLAPGVRYRASDSVELAADVILSTSSPARVSEPADMGLSVSPNLRVRWTPPFTAKQPKG